MLPEPSHAVLVQSPDPRLPKSERTSRRRAATGQLRMLELGQKSVRTHSSHRGCRAWQIWRPWRIKRRESAVQSAGMTTAQTCRSTIAGSGLDASPSRLVTRRTCVSTGNPGIPKPTPRMAFAPFRPIPGNLRSSSIVLGTSPPWRSTNARLAPMIVRALVRKNPRGLMSASTASGPARASDIAVGKRRNKRGVIRLTRTSRV